MSIKLTEVTRGPIVECIHHGDIAVVDFSGRLLRSAGDPHKTSYMRSAAKPIQALNVVLSGAADHFKLTGEELAVICSSHYAEPDHRRAISGILAKAGLDESFLQCGTVPSLRAEIAFKQAWDRETPSPLYNDCSGKHSGMLAVCVNKKYRVDNYLEPAHPAQQEILEIIARLCGTEPGKIAIGTDGCSAPVHALPLYNMAWGFARLAKPVDLDEAYRTACQKIFQAAVDNPRMISGTGGFCTELIRATAGKLIGKIGAEGVYCIGIRSMGIGVAVKIENGNTAVIPPVVMEVLRELDTLSPSEMTLLDRFIVMDSLNDRKIKVGEIRPAFTLQ